MFPLLRRVGVNILTNPSMFKAPDTLSYPLAARPPTACTPVRALNTLSSTKISNNPLIEFEAPLIKPAAIDPFACKIIEALETENIELLNTTLKENNEQFYGGVLDTQGNTAIHYLLQSKNPNFRVLATHFLYSNTDDFYKDKLSQDFKDLEKAKKVPETTKIPDKGHPIIKFGLIP